MYCERCGKQLDDALNFCNGCGAQLRNTGDTQAQRSILNTLLVALIVIVTGGIGVLAGLLAILLDRVPNFEPVMAFSIFYLATLFGICFLIMRQVSKLIDAKLAGKNIYDPAPAKTTAAVQPLVQLPPKTTAQLEEQRQPASVVDATTRTLEEVPLRRN